MTMTDEVPGVELARAQPLLPLAPDDARAAMTAYQELCRAVLTPDDMQRVDDKEFVKRSGFQKLAAAYGVSTEIVSLDIERDPDGEILRARAIVRATHPTGRHAEGDGACSTSERRFRRGGQKIDHDLPATAVTRATNRAISNLVAFGTVSAEEADGAASGTNAALPGWAKPLPDVGEIATVLTDLFTRVGVENPAAATGKVGQAIFDACDDTVPVGVADAIKAVAAAIHTPLPETPVDAQVVDTHDTQEETP